MYKRLIGASESGVFNVLKLSKKWQMHESDTREREIIDLQSENEVKMH